MVETRALNCPSCGAPLEVRGFAHTLNVVCGNCLSVLDAKDPNLQVLQKFELQERIKPLIPLGTKGKLHGAAWQAIGFQERTISVEGVDYSWNEYLLFNPYKGFRYLTVYDGHWNDVQVLQKLPALESQRRARLDGETYQHFQSSVAKTTYILGEFPWQVRVGDTAQVADFVAPPRMLSAEIVENETTWSLGEYIAAAAVWQAFQLPGKAPSPNGIYANQPSPAGGKTGRIWKAFLFALAALLLLSQVTYLAARREEVFRDTYTFQQGRQGEPSFVTNIFELRGRISDVEVRTNTDLDNNWAYFNYALINDANGEAYNFGREVSYYSGRDSDGAWSEGSRNDRAVIPSVPPGRYYLRIEPEADANAPPVRYEVAVRRDVPVMSFFWIAALALMVPPVISVFRWWSFERSRWAESDHPNKYGSSN